MRLSLPVLCSLAALVQAPAYGQEPAPGGGFVAGVDDLPLMAGLAEDPEAGIVFDKPSGRIVEAYASGQIAPEAVVRFYEETLPQLGWEQLGALAFTREGEVLRITLTREDGGVRVRFFLLPD